jgi:hypothetical protein
VTGAVLVLAIDDPLRANAPFPARVEEVLLRQSPVEGDVRLQLPDDVGEWAEGMSNPVSALLEEMDDTVPKVDVSDLEQSHLVFRSPRRAMRRRAARSR